ncbi:phosphoadenosine phosphosulfate reductase [Allopseudospirillum japonicum]|uniref:Adenosine 5'-phosphosulfate reductase n=1 Tax=Allopseudospirillum japonicum TaxID=64971 RepID=A0A1H6SZI1_9GAMM|nr:phosphoadenylyl-sulfate reductase [Allopseudospirillum japonicum]SEI68962.1 phosphoadenosine phosphosulfate reductase [Allopseudospirillum japonicum]
MPTQDQINQWALEQETASPKEILALAASQFDKVAISFSGAEDVLLIEFASKLPDFREKFHFFSLDTGRLHPETYRYLEQVRQHYQIDLHLLAPQTEAVQDLVRQKGLFSFYQDGHQECCAIRKVEPLKRQLAQVDAWITGQRRDQSPGTRQQVATVELDQAFATPTHALVKFNPLATWSSSRVWEYIRMFDVPYNPLHQQGMISIGCEPCTRAVLPNQHEREGRWWWENAEHKECGLHATNIQPST